MCKIMKAFACALCGCAMSLSAFAQEMPEAAISGANVNISVELVNEGPGSPSSKISTGLLAEGLRTLSSNKVARTRNMTAQAPARVDVIVECTDISDSLLSRIAELGGSVEEKSVRFKVLRISLPKESLQPLAEHADVKIIREWVPPIQNKTNTSEGVRAHMADKVQQLGYTGKNVKIGVISDSVRYLSNVQATGDLPSVTVLSGASGVLSNGSDTGEGTAMLEIVHDMAPDAQLYFATRGGTKEIMAENIYRLQEAGCDIIVDDITFFDEFAFGYDVVAKAVEDVSAAGVLYLTSAGNSGHAGSSTRYSTWEGDFYDKDGNGVHYFKTGNTAYNNTQVQLPNSSAITLQWADDWNNPSSDYDLWIYAKNKYGETTQILKSENRQGSGSGFHPYEIVKFSESAVQTLYNNGGCLRVVVRKISGSNRFLRLDGHRSSFSINTKGNIYGHNGTDSAVSVGMCAAPSSGTFSSSTPIKGNSSDGPRRIFYNLDGSLVTPGNLSSTGGRVVNKPDCAGADTVSCATTGFASFPGTSAAAPHIAAIAALMLEKNPTLTPSQVKSILYASTWDIDATGWDIRSGYGIVNAQAAVAATEAYVPCEQPDAPTGLSANYAWDSSSGKYKVTLSWNKDFPSGTTYTVYKSSSYIDVWDHVCTTTTSTTFTDTTGLSAGSTVYYAVTATLSGSTMEGLGARLTATAPSAPTKTLSSIAISGASSVTSGSQTTYTCTATYSDKSTATVAASWSFSPTTSYATIGSATGVLKAGTVSSSQTVTVKASYAEGGVTKTSTKTVTIAPASAATVHALSIPAAGGTDCTVSFTIQTGGSYYLACTPPTWITTLKNSYKSGGISISIGSGAGTTTLGNSTTFTVTVSAGANATGSTQSWDYLITGPENHTVRITQPSQAVSQPTVTGDAGATVTGDATSGYVVKPSSGKTSVEVVLPSGLDPSKVTVEVGTGVKTLTPHGAAVRIVNAGYDITGYLDVPTAVGGTIDLSQATVKASVVKDALDTTKAQNPAVVVLTPSSPSIRTAKTKPGLTYTFSEGTTLGGLKQKSTKTGDGKVWTPTITVKGGTSGFYCIGVTK